MLNYSNLIASLVPVARNAGEAIMDVYNDGFEHDIKSDGSPVTKADKAAEKIILDGLRSHAPDIAVVSEENPSSHDLQAPDIFFLVDPLDGTKEFLKRDGKGAFTVNIALIEHKTPTMGIVFAPALNRMFYGAQNLGVFENDKSIKASAVPIESRIAVASQSHRDENTDRWLDENNIQKTVSIGSSLKFALLACGEAHVYPRFSPTMEWDTAAGDAILRAAGGMMFNPDGKPFEYGKANYLNGGFIAKAPRV
jgi:3'(2'), 5'-bisphosphate nucleotidase